ncbi:neutral/alkaline non-lysosomal ceramidase N-terminal domain-containing protein [Microbulbifer sp. THAF38]|uniref:neutral/alkaline non-lysosomal ceramidase N-terminal domain-containing protein n=1 Tax=Microbulbifer sp. THAF38 TaxID=2587856 RepID=UPI0012684E41|nr:neutral/alkaline non-lysosomal ceramidase N-terminal domain-containing protein [Microbulbifer sp. THAF38]QFT54275.1 Neutral ceramidase precursor [Microbulbifer sp. THAF38]
MKKIIIRWYAAFFMLLGYTPFALSAEWLLGAGKYDITGPAADVGMVGYGETSQTTKGIHSRLWSRAFVIANAQDSERLVFVSADLQGIPQGVKQGVIAKLKSKYGNSRYTDENVMLTATHTHVGPGGYDHYVMLNMSALGYAEDNYNAIVEGIYQSIVSANNGLAEGDIYLEQGTLLNTSINRNPEPYAQNPDAEDYQYDTNKTMTQLKLVNANNEALGIINWFAVHNVSLGTSQRQLSSDHKGAASYLFEQWAASQVDTTGSFVAAFANSNLGDASPNICGPGDGCGSSEYESLVLAAEKQVTKAKSLYSASGSKLLNDLDYRHQYIYFPGYTVAGEYTGEGQQNICEGAVGWSFTAGSSWDGPSGIDGIFEGMSVENEGTEWDRSESLFESVISGFPLFGLMNAFSAAAVYEDTQDDPCQYPKPTFVERKVIGQELYTPYLPFQMFRIGSLVLVAAPGEMTTMAGRRLQEQVLSAMQGHGISTVVIAGLANAYTGYVTTHEEFDRQHYEGGHTIYGPNTLAAYQQIYTEMADAMNNDLAVDAGPTPADLSDDQIIHVIGVVYDDKRLWESFGQVWDDVRNSYSVGDTVSASFRSGHPRNNLRTGGTFIEVQRKVNGNWETYLTDNDLDTRFIWTRDTAVDCLACSFAEGQWVIGEDTPAGTYRIKHKGNWKSGWSGKITSYSGKSSSFTVNK